MIDYQYLTNEEERVNAYADDTKVKELIEKRFESLLPLHSRLNSLTYVEKDEALAWKFNVNMITGLIEMLSEEDMYTKEDFTLLESINMHLKLKVNDSQKGRKLKALTQHTKIMQVSTEQKGGWWRK